MACALASAVPVIDIAPLLDGGPVSAEARLNATEHINAALRGGGIFLAINHGISPERRKRIFDAARNLFALDDETKESHSLHNHRGFLPFAKESGLTKSVFEPKEGFSYGFDWPAGVASPSPLHATNNFPPNLSIDDRVQLEWQCSKSALIAERLSVALGSLPEYASFLAGMREGGAEISLMRLFHYIPQEDTRTKDYLLRVASSLPDGIEDKHILGSAPHSDWGWLTIILPDDAGLQVYDDQGQWRDVPFVPDALVVNGGDFLRLVLGGATRSPIHRVLAPIVRERTSFVYFAYPGHDSHMPQASSSPTVGADGEIEYNTLDPTGAEHLGGGGGGGGGDTFAKFIHRKWQGVLRY
jgi:isopenicillin N synthase-like dioxygenase